MKKFNTFCLVLTILFPSIIFSQITITQSDFTNLIVVENTSTSLSNSNPQTIDIGQTGGNNQWNFEGIVANEMLEISYMSAISGIGSEYLSDFPTADVVGYLQFTVVDGSDTTTSESWTYYSTNNATLLGTGVLTAMSSGGQQFSSSTITTHYPPFNQYVFPINFSDSWTTKDSSESVITTDQGTFVSNLATLYEINIDAWGTMTMPGGKVVEALRSREVTTTTSYIAGIPISTGTDIKYFFMGKGGESFSILVQSDEPTFSGSRTGTVSWHDDNVTSVEKLESLPMEFGLKQNYPNPFNPTTKIEYSIAEPSFVNLRVYDILGNEVAELVNESQSSGNFRCEFDGSDLASGTYIVRLNANTRTETMKITLMK